MAGEDTEDTNVRFCWTLRPDDAARIGATLNASHPQELKVGDAPSMPGGDPDVKDLLLSVGLHLDQEPAAMAGTLRHLDGVATVSVLTESLEDLMHTAPTGFIVDTRFDSVQIEEHQAVGRGTIVLVDSEGARLLGSRQEAAVQRALADAGAAYEA